METWQETTAYKLNDGSTVYLNGYARQALNGWTALADGRMTVAQAEATIAAKPDHPAVPFARLAIEQLAITGPAKNLVENHAKRDVVIRAAAALQDEIWPPVRHEVVPQDDTCRHGISYKLDCAACDA